MTARRPGEKSVRDGKYKMTMTIKGTRPMHRKHGRKGIQNIGGIIAAHIQSM
jgi:hypothetical protein